MQFLVSDGPLGDRNSMVRQEMSDAGVALVTLRGKETLEPLMAVLKQICLAQASVLDRCLSAEARGGLSHSALVLTRRGIRRLLQSKHCENALGLIIKELTSASTTSPANSILLGVVAGVCVRLPKVAHLFETHTGAILDYYIKIILGSKSALPNQQVHGLDEFFSRFAKSDSINSTVLPTIEKGILRSPENVLKGPIVALAQSLPSEVDIAPTVSTKLLKPILSSLTSTNAIIREGASQSLQALLARNQDELEVAKIVKELISHLKASKTAAADLRVSICEALRVTPSSDKTSIAIIEGLLAVATKETNEAALRHELAAIAAHSTLALENGIWTKEITDTISKGLNEKRPSMKKIWITGISTALLGLKKVPSSDISKNFVIVVLEIASEVYVEIVAKPLAAATAGTVAMAYIIPSFIQHPALSSLIPTTKAKLSPQAVGRAAVQQQSFLLNPQVYTKLNHPGDQAWAREAVLGVDTYLADTSDEGQSAWGRLLLHLMLAPESDPETLQASISCRSYFFVRIGEHTSKWWNDIW
jgi:hypothetical protein